MLHETKARMVIVTDPREIEAVRLENETGAIDLPRGGFLPDGTCVAYALDMERWRSANLRTVPHE